MNIIFALIGIGFLAFGFYFFIYKLYKEIRKPKEERRLGLIFVVIGFLLFVGLCSLQPTI